MLYNGTGRWTAARDIAELIVSLPNALARYRPQHRYHLIDEGRIGEETLEQATSVAAELVRLETLAVEGPEALRPILRRLGTRLQGPRYASLRRALTVWFARVLLGPGGVCSNRTGYAPSTAAGRGIRPVPNV